MKLSLEETNNLAFCGYIKIVPHATVNPLLIFLRKHELDFVFWRGITKNNVNTTSASATKATTCAAKSTCGVGLKQF